MRNPSPWMKNQEWKQVGSSFFLLRKLSNLRAKDSFASHALSSFSHISKFDPKPIVALSKPSSKPSYLEPSESPKLS